MLQINPATIFRIVTYCFLFFTSIVFNSGAQVPVVTFNHWTVDDGLSQSTVQAIVQDRQGFMWFGTRDGLNKFDGYDFTIYRNDPEKQGSISGNYINALLIDSAGELWIANSKGLDRFNRKLDSFEKIGGGHRLIECLFQDSKGNIWVGSQQGLLIFDEKTNSLVKWKFHEDNLHSLEGHFVANIKEDHNGDLWIGTRQGLFRLDRKRNTLRRYAHSSSDKTSLCDDKVKYIHIDINQTIWIGTDGGGFTRYNEDTDNFTNSIHSTDMKGLSNAEVIMCISEGPGNDELWLGSENGGVIVYNYQTKAFSSHRNAAGDPLTISHNSIRSIHKDKIGNIWVGTYAAGIDFVPVTGQKFMHVASNPLTKNGLNNNVVKSISEDADGNLWIGTDGGGINFYDKRKNQFTYFKNDPGNKNSAISNYIHFIGQYSKDTLMIGYHRGGFDLLNVKTLRFTHFLTTSDRPYDDRPVSVGWLFKDRTGNIWAGTWDGLKILDMKTMRFTHFRHLAGDPYSLRGRIVYAVREDQSGNKWVGTDHGLHLFEKENSRFIPYPREGNKEVQAEIPVVTIYIDKHDNVWAGTLGWGLILVNKKTGGFTYFTEKDGLPNNIINGILEDDRGNLWLSTNKGISRFNVEKRSFKNYGINDGIQANEFKRNSCFKNSDGEMFFGGINGYNQFHPDKMRDNPHIPVVVFTDFQLFNKSVEVGPQSILKEHVSNVKEIVLSHDQSVFTFQYAALNYINSKKNQYAYKMEGVDKEWTYVKDRRYATYTNLSPSKYVFHVRGSNNDGVWNEEGASITIRVTPPFWNTLWFKGILTLAVIGSAISWYRLRIRTIKKQKALLEEQVTVRTAELRAANDEITLLYSEIKDSIRAAEIIQKSILPSPAFIKKHLHNSFIFYRPRDVVSGDFYWFDIKDDKIILAVVDCTGHGVSGAFMSINGFHLLNHAIDRRSNGLDASGILNRLNENIIQSLHQQDEDSETTDGMDVALCVIDANMRRLQFAGANLPLYIIRGEELIQIPGDRYPIGLLVKDNIQTFTSKDVELFKGDVIYIFSDGYADQLGGGKGFEKFMYKRFRELLLTIKGEEMEKQLRIIEDTLISWKGNQSQTDDILIIGWKV